MRISAFKILITFLTLLTFTQVKISYLTIKFPNILFARSSRYNLIEDSLTEGVFKGRKRFSVMHSVKSTSRSNMMKFAFALVAVLALASPLQAYNVPRTGTGVLADDVQEFVDLLDLEPLTPPTNVRMVRAAGGIRGMLDEVKALVPKEKIRELKSFRLWDYLIPTPSVFNVIIIAWLSWLTFRGARIPYTPTGAALTLMAPSHQSFAYPVGDVNNTSASLITPHCGSVQIWLSWVPLVCLVGMVILHPGVK